MGDCPGCRREVAGDRCDHCGAAQRVGHYRIREVRVQNQHGRLYLALDAKDRRVALKELCFMQTPSFEALDAFDREARILCALEHPCLPRFIESFQHGEGINTRLYLAQEFIDGQSLEERLQTHYFEESEVRSIAEQVLHILLWLQARSPAVIHRDVKPANLMTKPDGTIVLVDFGAARDQGATAGATQVGTFGFMPIEQLAGIVDKTTDVYALGASLVRLLTRREPWKLLDDPWKHMTASLALRRWLQKATARRPEDRFASAADALAALRAPSRAARWRPIAMAALGAAVVAGGGVAYGVHHEITKPEKPEVAAPVPAHGLKQPTCTGAPLARTALFEAVRQPGGFERVLGLMAAYRSTVEAMAGTQLPEPLDVAHFLALPHGGNGPILQHATAWGTMPDTLDDALLVIDGNAAVASARNSIVIATGNVSISRAEGSIVIAGGCTSFGDIHRSLVIAGAAVTPPSPSRVQDDYAIESSIVASPLIRAFAAPRSTLLGGSWIERGSSPEHDWQPVYDRLAALREPAPDCDEVTCILNNYEGTCCDKFRKVRDVQLESTDGAPEALDRSMIVDGVRPVKALVMKCGDTSDAKGAVKVSVRVAPDGSITSVTVKQTPDPALGACVAKAMQRAHFAKTQTGGSFGYPFVF